MVSTNQSVSMAAKRAALKSFGARLQAARNNCGLSQESVAQTLQVSTQTVRNWEAGRTEPSALHKDQLDSLYGSFANEVFIEPGLDNATSDSRDELSPENARLAQAFVDFLVSNGQTEVVPPEAGLDPDCVFRFNDGDPLIPHKIIVEWKTERAHLRHVRQVETFLETLDAAFGLLIEVEDATEAMRAEADRYGSFYSHVWDREFPRIQIRTIGELLTGRGFDLPISQEAGETAPVVSRLQPDELVNTQRD